jgi:hypothetical protein
LQPYPTILFTHVKNNVWHSAIGNLSAKQSALLQPPGKKAPLQNLKAFAAATKSGDQEQTYCIVRSSSTSQSRMADDALYTSFEVLYSPLAILLWLVKP